MPSTERVARNLGVISPRKASSNPGVCSSRDMAFLQYRSSYFSIVLRLTNRQPTLAQLALARWVPLEPGMPSFCTATFTRKSDTIRAFVALVAVPFPPVSTRSADATVPGATSLNHLSPAKRIPVRLTTFPAIIVLEELLSGTSSQPQGNSCLACRSCSVRAWYSSMFWMAQRDRWSTSTPFSGLRQRTHVHSSSHGSLFFKQAQRLL